MRRQRRSFFDFFWRVASWLFWLGLTVACFRNVFWDNEEIEQLAARAACNARPGCHAQMTRVMRTPIGHSFQFAAPGRPVAVECMRAYILVGDYACKGKESSGVEPLSTSPSVSTSASTPTAKVPKPQK